MPTGLILLCVLGLTPATRADAEPCKNEKFRVGASASLPDCRAYELVTPADKGRTQALTFTAASARAFVSGSGDGVALETIVPFGPNPSALGARAVFLRNPESGWEMYSAVESGADANAITMKLFSSNLSDVAFKSETDLNLSEQSPDITLEAGPVGGPYAPMARIPRKEVVPLKTQLLGASSTFSDVLFASVDHNLPLSGADGAAAAEATPSGAMDLYDWTGGHLRLVNATAEGLPLADPCGATLGGGSKEPNASATVNAVSEDGSKIFFTIPFPPEAASSETGCNEPAALYMRVSGGEPIEVSAPEPNVHLGPSEIKAVRYNYATPDGSKVFFNTETPLTAGESANEKRENKLFEYNTEAPEGERLKLVGGVPPIVGVGLLQEQGITFSEDGSIVYVEAPSSGEVHELYRLDTSTGERTFVADAVEPNGSAEPSYSTPNGDFFLFTSQGVYDEHGEPEPRGFGHNEMYRYNGAAGSVMCVTCGAGIAPSQGQVVLRATVLEPADVVSPLTQLSEDGQEVFFQTTAQLVPQDVNSTETEIALSSGTPGLDVYEWEADGSGDCELAQGCTYLLSTGEDIGPSTLIGASKDGSNVFFATPAQLVPQDTDELPDIYDARVDGGFAPPAEPIPCLSCQGVGSPPLLFNVPASGTFMGAGNPTPQAGTSGGPTITQKLTKALKACRIEWSKRKRVACKKRARKRYGASRAKAAKSNSRITKED